MRSYEIFYESLRSSLSGTPSGMLRASLRSLLSGTLSGTLLASLMASLLESLLESLKDSLWDAVWDTGWVCYHTYCRDVLGVVYSEKSSKMLDRYKDLLSSCFGVWIIPDGTVILCERPTSVKVEDGKLVDRKWAA